VDDPILDGTAKDYSTIIEKDKEYPRPEPGPWAGEWHKDCFLVSKAY
jgi:hypothetical protein